MACSKTAPPRTSRSARRTRLPRRPARSRAARRRREAGARTAAAKAAGSSASAMSRPGVTGSPSAPTVVETTALAHRHRLEDLQPRAAADAQRHDRQRRRARRAAARRPRGRSPRLPGPAPPGAATAGVGFAADDGERDARARPAGCAAGSRGRSRACASSFGSQSIEPVKTRRTRLRLRREPRREVLRVDAGRDDVDRRAQRPGVEAREACRDRRPTPRARGRTGASVRRSNAQHAPPLRRQQEPAPRAGASVSAWRRQISASTLCVKSTDGQGSAAGQVDRRRRGSRRRRASKRAGRRAARSSARAVLGASGTWRPRRAAGRRGGAPRRA